MKDTFTLQDHGSGRDGGVAVPGTLARVRFSPAPRPAISFKPPSGLSLSQREALHTLLHPDHVTGRSRWTRRDRGLDFAWGGMLAGLLALAVASIGAAPAFLHTADRLYAEAHAPAKTAFAAPQSSVATRRTM